MKAGSTGKGDRDLPARTLTPVMWNTNSHRAGDEDSTGPISGTLTRIELETKTQLVRSNSTYFYPGGTNCKHMTQVWVTSVRLIYNRPYTPWSPRQRKTRAHRGESNNSALVWCRSPQIYLQGLVGARLCSGRLKAKLPNSALHVFFSISVSVCVSVSVSYTYTYTQATYSFLSVAPTSLHMNGKEKMFTLFNFLFL